MPTYRISAPDGITLDLSGEQPPTKQQVDRIFAAHRAASRAESDKQAPGAGSAFMSGVGETTIPGAQPGEGVLRQALNAPGRMLSVAREQFTPDPSSPLPGSSFIPRGLMLPQKTALAPFLAAIEAVKQLGGRPIEDAPEILTRGAGPFGSMVADLSQRGGEAVGSGDPNAYARLGGNIGGLALQTLLAAKAPQIGGAVSSGAGSLAAVAESPALRRMVAGPVGRSMTTALGNVITPGAGAIVGAVGGPAVAKLGLRGASSLLRLVEKIGGPKAVAKAEAILAKAEPALAPEAAGAAGVAPEAAVGAPGPALAAEPRPAFTAADLRPPASEYGPPVRAAEPRPAFTAEDLVPPQAAPAAPGATMQEVLARQAQPAPANPLEALLPEQAPPAVGPGPAGFPTPGFTEADQGMKYMWIEAEQARAAERALLAKAKASPNAGIAGKAKIATSVRELMEARFDKAGGQEWLAKPGTGDLLQIHLNEPTGRNVLRAQGAENLADIPITPIESRGFNGYGYDPATRVARVEFKDGRIYRYHDVPPEVMARIASAESKGGELIRLQNRFPGTREGSGPYLPTEQKPLGWTDPEALPPGEAPASVAQSPAEAPAAPAAPPSEAEMLLREVLAKVPTRGAPPVTASTDLEALLRASLERGKGRTGRSALGHGQ